MKQLKEWDGVSFVLYGRIVLVQDLKIRQCLLSVRFQQWLRVTLKSREEERNKDKMNTNDKGAMERHRKELEERKRVAMIKEAIVRAFGIIAVAARSAGDTVTQIEAIELIEAQCKVVRELTGEKI